MWNQAQPDDRSPVFFLETSRTKQPTQTEPIRKKPQDTEQHFHLSPNVSIVFQMLSECL